MEITIDIYDIINSCSRSEKRDLYNELLEDGACLSDEETALKQREERRLNYDEMMAILRSLNNYELKKLLCDLLYVPSLHDPESLRKALEPIVTSL